MNLRRIIKLKFDRSFSRASVFVQLFWLLAVIVVTCLLFLLLKPSHITAWEVVEVYVDPGNFSNADNFRWYALLVVVVGAIFFSSMLISVLSNVLERRIEAVRNGEVFYHFNNHVVILGNDEMVVGIIKKIVVDTPKCDIVLQTQQDVETIAQTLHTQLCATEEQRLTIISARRDSLEDLRKMRIKHAREVYILGEQGEQDTDALTLNSLKFIAQIASDSVPIKCITQLRYQSTFALFQTTDLPDHIKKNVIFHPFNFNESWARKVFVENQNFDKSVAYKPLDYTPITKDSPKSVHLVIAGMTPMGIALAVEAAHICHFPNFATRGAKTKITFIDPAAHREMEYFLGRHRPLLSHCSYTFRRFVGGVEECAAKMVFPPATEVDFLDIEFEFIEGNIAADALQGEIDCWAQDPNQLLTIACCYASSAQNIAVGFYLPRSVYETVSGHPTDIPVLVQQSLCGDLATVLHDSIRYGSVRPFGMTNEGYDERLDKMEWAQRINNIYWNEKLPDVFCEQTIEQQWSYCSVTDKWSNIYNAISIPTKLRSIGLDMNSSWPLRNLSTEEVGLLCEVEHNRWNVEKLLAGYIPTTKAQDSEIEAEFERIWSGEIEIPKLTRKKFLNKSSHIHYDIRPYSDLRPDHTAKNINRYDILLSEGLVKIVGGTRDTATRNI